MTDDAFAAATWIVMLSGVGLVALTYLPAIFIKRRQRQQLAERCRGRLVLTYDDGPDPNLTPRLVALLKRYHAKASFFLLGFRAQRSPGACEMLLRAGHDLGCHSDSHLNSWWSPPWTAIADISGGYRSVEPWVKSNALFRPPFGKMTTWTWLALRFRGAKTAWWTCDGCDTYPELPDPAAVIHEIVEHHGGVVLMHGHDRGNDREQYVLDLTEQLLIAATKHGLQICTLSELLEC